MINDVPPFGQPKMQRQVESNRSKLEASYERSIQDTNWAEAKTQSLSTPIVDNNPCVNHLPGKEIGPSPNPKPPDLKDESGTVAEDPMMEDLIPTIRLSDPTPLVGGDEMQMA